MGQRRFRRLTNGFPKKLDNHVAAVALYVAHYNLCRVHQAGAPLPTTIPLPQRCGGSRLYVDGLLTCGLWDLLGYRGVRDLPGSHQRARPRITPHHSDLSVYRRRAADAKRATSDLTA
jgi:hypothetical protein